MADLELMRELAIEGKSKILLLVMDGVGGLPLTPDGLTELEAANTPHLDALAARSICGMGTAVAPGVTPGSGPGHLSLFGTILSSTRSGGACWRRWVLDSICSPLTWRPAATFARSTSRG